MQESWEVQWEDYYAILQVHPSAELEVIEGAYRRLVQKYHPDISKDPTATERMKKINVAYEVLRDTEKRERYHAEWIRRAREATGWQEAYAVEKPIPDVQPEYLFFGDAEPREINKAYFILRNTGGPYEKIRVWTNKPDSWVRVTGYFSLTDSDELPMRVEIEAKGEDWDETYSESITVKLDEEATEVKVHLQTKPAPARTTVEKGIPVLEVSCNRLDFDSVRIGTNASKAFRIANKGGGIQRGSIKASAPWIKVTPKLLDPNKHEQEITVTVTTRGLKLGFAGQGMIRINTNGGKAFIDVHLVAEGYKDALRRFRLKLLPIAGIIGGLLIGLLLSSHIMAVFGAILSLFWLIWAVYWTLTFDFEHEDKGLGCGMVVFILITIATCMGLSFVGALGESKLFGFGSFIAGAAITSGIAFALSGRLFRSRL